MKYKGFVGSAEYSDADGVFFGKVQNTQSLISYEGATIEELETDFHDAVDDYLAVAESLSGILPQTLNYEDAKESRIDEE